MLVNLHYFLYWIKCTDIKICLYFVESCDLYFSFMFQEQVKSNTHLTEQHICDALDILRGAVMIVYPMNLPPHDPIREELENRESLAGTQDQKMVNVNQSRRDKQYYFLLQTISILYTIFANSLIICASEACN